MITIDDFMGMIKAFRMLGMAPKEKEELELYFKVLTISKISKEEFENGYLKLCMTKTSFWDNNNLPSMVIEKAVEYRAEKKKKAFQDRVEAKRLADEQYRQKVLAEYNADPEYFKEQSQKLKRLSQGIGN